MPMSKQIGILNSSEPFESLCGILTGCITIKFLFWHRTKTVCGKDGGIANSDSGASLL